MFGFDVSSRLRIFYPRVGRLTSCERLFLLYTIDKGLAKLEHQSEATTGIVSHSISGRLKSPTIITCGYIGADSSKTLFTERQNC